MLGFTNYSYILPHCFSLKTVSVHLNQKVKTFSAHFVHLLCKTTHITTFIPVQFHFYMTALKHEL